VLSDGAQRPVISLDWAEVGGQLHAPVYLPPVLTGPSGACQKAMLCCVSRLDTITHTHTCGLSLACESRAATHNGSQIECRTDWRLAPHRGDIAIINGG
jgi:hypothetical protein